MSQLDLASAAEVSARHISFLETGRSEPSREMVLRLATSLDVPLREQNALLAAAGHEAQYPETSLQELPSSIRQALELMQAKHEPYPLVVMNRHYDVVSANHGAMQLLTTFAKQLPAPPLNVLRLVFDPEALRDSIDGWESLARPLLGRVQRELMASRGDTQLAHLFSALCAYPRVPATWREHDFSLPSEATLSFKLQKGDLRAAFFTTLTVFNAPHDVTLEELKIESYYPLDRETEQLCAGFGNSG